MIPIKLTLSNFISHIHSTLDFTKFNSALIVGYFEGNPNISNGLGKTALVVCPSDFSRQNCWLWVLMQEKWEAPEGPE